MAGKKFDKKKLNYYKKILSKYIKPAAFDLFSYLVFSFFTWNKQ